MGAGFTLQLNGKIYTEAMLAGGAFPSTGTEFELTTLSFCRDWLNGLNEFQVTTSGSTGTPKTITFTREQLIASARLTQQALGLKAGMTALLCLDPSFIAGRMMIVRSIFIGMNLVAVEPSANPLNAITQLIDFAAFVPYQISTILNSAIEKLKSTGIIIIGGGPVDADLEEKFSILGSSKVYTTFGMTETLTHIALRQLHPERETFFTALPGVSVTTDTRDCLVIQAPHLPEVIVTNDVVELYDESRFTWLGRIDNVINTGGVKVNPEHIEQTIRPLIIPYAPSYFIGSMPDAAFGERIVLVLEGAIVKDTDELLAAIRACVPKFAVPKAVYFLPSFIYTPTGKINRKKTIALLKG